MKIDKVSGAHVQQPTLQQAKKPIESSPQTKTSEPEMNANTVALEKAQMAMAALSDVDIEKVARVREALANGKLELDSKALSQAMMQFHTGHE
ncbi:flagellar biosynthesis anti-sigma factor FlgM [Vibrio diazotrophicus]|jgi:negative regulator of flagellin synthesis FlgM|uniref:flagellar biosynthesis anti-sigma factor FlgM n=1 Tax=Vibrio diazotrophicus TaxID=685 RepID=UPI000C9E6079|nr:flagellar biosynthesis anti-sigma factor FlgM [Vibrio diazotrophicus]PNH95434.1 flagellar biosynthesis anti-sigma factor FlgM [Vibrio diazotrophicus]